MNGYPWREGYSCWSLMMRNKLRMVVTLECSKQDTPKDRNQYRACLLVGFFHRIQVFWKPGPVDLAVMQRAGCWRCRISRTGKNRRDRMYRRLNAGEMSSCTCMKTGSSCSIDMRLPITRPCLQLGQQDIKDLFVTSIALLPHDWNRVESSEEYDVSFKPLLRKVSGILSPDDLRGLCSKD